MLDQIKIAYEAATALPSPQEPDTIVAASVSSQPSYFIGRDHLGRACALVQTTGNTAAADIKLRHLQVRQGIRCKVASPHGGEQTIEGSLVTCAADDLGMVELFLRLVADGASILGETPSGHTVARWVQDLATLFSRLETAGRKLLRGLWAELLVIHEAPDPELMLRRWHASPDELLDFLAPDLGIEVKSCQDLERIHHFSLAQLQPPQQFDVWIASVPVRPDPHGTSTLQLLAAVEDRLSPEARATARSVVFATAGDALRDDQHHRFDIGTARSGLRFLDARAVPRIEGDLPKEVLQVTLTVRCRDLPEVGRYGDVIRRIG